MSFFNLKIGFLCIHPRFRIREIIVSKILFARSRGDNLLIYVRFVRLKRAWRAFSFNLSSAFDASSTCQVPLKSNALTTTPPHPQILLRWSNYLFYPDDKSKFLCYAIIGLTHFSYYTKYNNIKGILIKKKKEKINVPLIDTYRTKRYLV